MYKLGLSTTGKTVCEDLFRTYAEGGIYGMEISLPSESYSSFDFKSAREWADRYGVCLWSFHLPFKPFDTLDISKKELQKSSLEFLKELVKKAGDIGIDKCILHPGGITKNDPDIKTRMEYAKESLDIMAEEAAKCGTTIVVENLPPICLSKGSPELLELVSVNDKLKICFDTNHLLTGESFEDFLPKVKDRLVTLHISDYDLINERHWLPGEGKVDWQKMYNAIKATGYDGLWLYEIAFAPVVTISRNRDLTVADFVRNADEIFNNKPLTVFGTPKEDLYK